MSKIKLGQRPEFIERVVAFNMPDGSEGTIICRFRYRTRKEFGTFLKEMLVPPVGKADDKTSIETAIALAVDQNARYLNSILVGWNLDEELSVDTLTQFADELPAGARAVMDAYAGAISEGRLGN